MLASVSLCVADFSGRFARYFLPESLRSEQQQHSGPRTKAAISGSRRAEGGNEQFSLWPFFARSSISLLLHILLTLRFSIKSLSRSSAFFQSRARHRFSRLSAGRCPFSAAGRSNLPSKSLCESLFADDSRNRIFSGPCEEKRFCFFLVSAKVFGGLHENAAKTGEKSGRHKFPRNSTRAKECQRMMEKN